MKKRIVPELVAMMLVLLLSGNIFAEGAMIGINGGAAKLYGAESEQFNVGFNVGGSIMFKIGENARFGIRAGYTNYSPDEDGFSDKVGGVESEDLDGSAWSVDFYPVLRFTTGWDFPVNVFTEAGAGMSFFNSDVEVSGEVNGTSIDTTLGVDTEVRLLTNVSIGFSIGSLNSFLIDFYPSLNVVFLNEDETWVYTTYNLGLVFIF